jgi:hypothetical protein
MQHSVVLQIDVLDRHVPVGQKDLKPTLLLAAKRLLIGVELFLDRL